MRAAVTGATGMIGRALVRELVSRGDEVTALSRDPRAASETLPEGVEAAAWPRTKEERPPLEALHGRDAIFHLLGEPLDRRWTDAAKREIRDSRVLSTRNLVAAIGELAGDERPRTLVSQSATGWYGPRGDEQLTEDASSGGDWLAGVVREWEDEAIRARAHGVRTVVTRTGVVLSREGGAIARMLPFFKLALGGPVAGGRQWMPWVHRDDVAGALIHCAASELSGPVNVTAPEPVTNRELSTALGRVLRRPAFLPVPALALKVLYGEMSSVVTTGHRVVPARLLESGYAFRHPQLEVALRDVTQAALGPG
jgi:uncharacterized protein (TIGR01777 family)